MLCCSHRSPPMPHVELKLGRFDEAEANFRSALDIFEGVPGLGDARRGELLLDYAQLYRARDRKYEARVLERRAREYLRTDSYGLRDTTVDVNELYRRSR